MTRDAVLEAYCGMLDLLPAAACVFDVDGRLVGYSAQARALWGVSPAPSDPTLDDVAVGALRRLDDLPLPRDAHPMARALRRGAAVHGEHFRIARPDGSARLVAVHATPILDAHGAPQGGLCLFVDVTEQHAASHAQAERLRQREELRVALACDIRAGLDPLRRSAQDLAARARAAGRGPVDAVDHQLRHVTQLVDRLLNLEVDLDDAIA